MGGFYVLLYMEHRGCRTRDALCIRVEQTRESFSQRVCCIALERLDQGRGLGKIYSLHSY